MFATANRYLSSLSAVWICALVTLLTLVIAYIDHQTGYELSFSIMYLLPVGMGAWYLNGPMAYFICLACAATWGIADFTSGHIFENVGIPLWNTAVRGGFFLIVATLIIQLRNALRTQETLAQIDGLTGIPNARAFRQLCSSLCELSVRNNRSFAVGYIDLDNFKSVNDNFGHSIGDLVLKATAQALDSRLRTSDICARLGGDEFAIMLPETDLNGARLVFEELHGRLQEFAAENKWPIGFSIGVAVFHLSKGNPDAIIHCADELMYRVKHSGKNRIHLEEFESV